MSTLEELTETFKAVHGRYENLRMQMVDAIRNNAENIRMRQQYVKLNNEFVETTGERLRTILKALKEGRTEGQESELEAVNDEITTTEKTFNGFASGVMYQIDAEGNDEPVVTNLPPTVVLPTAPQPEEARRLPAYQPPAKPPQMERRVMEAPPGTDQRSRKQDARKPGRRGILSLGADIHRAHEENGPK